MEQQSRLVLLLPNSSSPPRDVKRMQMSSNQFVFDSQMFVCHLEGRQKKKSRRKDWRLRHPLTGQTEILLNHRRMFLHTVLYRKFTVEER